MLLSDWINVALCILSFLLAAISVVIVVITLRQNNRMIENSTRPYLTLYGGLTNFQSPQYFVILRNFGQSSAVITSFSSDAPLIALTTRNDVFPFSHIVGTTLAPNQAIQVPIDFNKTNQSVDCITFSIEYRSAEKAYSETAVLNLLAHTDFAPARASTKGSELQIISYAMQDIAIRQL